MRCRHLLFESVLFPLKALAQSVVWGPGQAQGRPGQCPAHSVFSRLQALGWSFVLLTTLLAFVVRAVRPLLHTGRLP